MSNLTALIVGNGHSSVNPYAAKLIKNSDLFRLNWFFLEPFPLFGRKVEIAFFGGEPYLIYLYDYLISKGIYSISNCVYRKLSHKRFFVPATKNNMIPFVGYSKFLSLSLSPVRGFDGATCLDCPQKTKVTSAVFLIHIALALGYKNISIVGIDFYADGSKPYPFMEPNFIKRIRLFYPKMSTAKIKEHGNYIGRHSLKADSQYIKELALKYSDVQFNVFVDDDRPERFWKEINNNIDNIKINRMPSVLPTPGFPFFMEEIEAGIESYKRKYFWKDKYMKFINIVFYSKRAVIVHFYYVLCDWLLMLWRSIMSFTKA